MKKFCGGEFPIILAVLGRDCALGRAAGDIGTPIGLRIIGEQLLHRPVQIQILEELVAGLALSMHTHARP